MKNLCPCCRKMYESKEIKLVDMDDASFWYSKIIEDADFDFDNALGRVENEEYLEKIGLNDERIIDFITKKINKVLRENTVVKVKNMEDGKTYFLGVKDDLFLDDIYNSLKQLEKALKEENEKKYLEIYKLLFTFRIKDIKNKISKEEMYETHVDNMSDRNISHLFYRNHSPNIEILILK